MSGCLNCGNQHPEIKAREETIIYCKYCDNYEQIVHIFEIEVSTSERMEKDELFQLLNEGRLKIVDYNDVKDQNRG